ncbi:HAD family hydrolase [Flavihumibacter sp. R14]|nr:HAD family hydrolase [Flavihumibacter soli]
MTQIYNNEAVIFDLDDLLYKEFDYMRSAFWAIAQMIEGEHPKKLFRMMMAQYFLGNRVLNWLSDEYLTNNDKYSLEILIAFYRNHKPDISISSEAFNLLEALKRNGNSIGLLTDGRSVTQRNKIEALGLNKWMNLVSVSEECGFEKPCEEPFLLFMTRFDSEKFVYLADNYNKDFVAPNKLGWRTIALLDNGLNIHIKNQSLNQINYPTEVVATLSEIKVSSYSN